ncbi:MAG: hypothetical protein IM613_17485 [Cytophagales bacterium]|nr:hypothetical protein [Cytophagales bacterium]
MKRILVLLFFIATAGVLMMSMERSDTHFSKTYRCLDDTVFVGSSNVAIIGFTTNVAAFSVKGESYHFGRLSANMLSVAKLSHGKPSWLTVQFIDGTTSKHTITSNPSDEIFEYKTCR